ncbi:DUF4157 domain-containing protein [Undibacterium sp. 14-3-2]|uniref:eCIS core domain-containing protein n=1 Tax=Undibacterium sp. 14-3-2 TaxID=2800129 RepID=UPI001F26E89F|nr:DUF4157 domain-containing protein [Undibacterium sp. 14-3-2]
MSSAAPLQQATANSHSEARNTPRQLRQNSARSASEKQSNFTDSRPQTAIQRRLRETAADSPQTTQLLALRRMAAASEHANQLKAMKATASAAALQRVEDEEALQAKFDAIQRVEEEEPLQGKFNTAQRVEEDEPLQNKLMTAQRAEDEELLQGKFAPVQRVEEDEPLQGKFNIAQRVEEDEPLQNKLMTAQRIDDEELLQGKFDTVQRQEQVAARPNNTGLPNQLKSGIESLSGMSMDHVKVHYNSSQPAQLNALAYAQGSDIHVAPGQEQHLPHEAWHVVQQAQGRVKPTMQMKDGVPVNDDVGLETEADVMGAKAASLGATTRNLKDAVLSDKNKKSNSAIQYVAQRQSDFAEDQHLENIPEERGNWGAIYSKFNVTFGEYVDHVLLHKREPALNFLNEVSEKDIRKAINRANSKKSKIKRNHGLAGIGKKKFASNRFRRGIKRILIQPKSFQKLTSRSKINSSLNEKTLSSTQLIQRAAIWNTPAHFAATDPPLVGLLAGAPNSDARFNLFMQNRTPGNFAGLDWGGGHHNSIAGKLRRPAGFHEWAPVSMAAHMQANWFNGGGLAYAAYQGLRTPTGATNFATTATPGVAIPHGGPGSPGAHGELFALVAGNATWGGFLTDLDNWATGAGGVGANYRAHNATVHAPPGRGW